MGLRSEVAGNRQGFSKEAANCVDVAAVSRGQDDENAYTDPANDVEPETPPPPRSTSRDAPGLGPPLRRAIDRVKRPGPDRSVLRKFLLVCSLLRVHFERAWDGCSVYARLISTNQNLIFIFGVRDFKPQAHDYRPI